MAGGIVFDSSDVHIEGQENDAKLRVRWMAFCRMSSPFDKKTYEALVSRVKLLSEMKLN